ncbi:hypothetical protein C8R43DRAFT_1031802 [Mycena crocata]|nr:hypothetical protein C8R43DRAFT_1031802 [Mycena crocata]
MGDLSDSESSNPPSPLPSPSAGKGKAKANTFLPYHGRSSLKRSKTSDQGSAFESQSHGSTRSRVSFEPQRRMVQADITDEDRTPSPEVREDDPKDKDYKESHIRRSRTVAGSSPQKRKEGSISTSAKNHVRDADPHKGVCLLTNALHPKRARQFCHCIPRSTSDLILTALEWWWQMLYWTLYIDTRYNMFPLMATWHIAMDADEWTLVPHHQLISRLLTWSSNVTKADPTGYNKSKRNPISESYGTQTEFVYYFMPLSAAMKEVAIHRYNEDFDPNNVETHLYPFSTIGPLTSHIHPHFVVFSAGEKLAKLCKGKSADEIDDLLESFAAVVSFGHEGTLTGSVASLNLTSLQDMVRLYDMWSVMENVPQKDTEPRHKWMHHDDEFKEELQPEKL